ncbi:F-box domain-containing protein [Caenorhabditis elegans]|uniref:F-box domain-containing protein n=1 Tax=Caenorhabditis elegans TaxID=6239 RepID=Q95XK8_CAEEL|nr:F-box domain-containing protein [Caenorhabditis elegans]CCD73844.1 F-box domain-containing protein [Caenorhabditis elegans]|eukprot:NP_497535.2 F-box A protein [Caenorhabditis elegans]
MSDNLKKPVSLLNLPLDITNLVLEKLEPMDRLSARKVCKNLRNFIDKLETRFEMARVDIYKNRVILFLNETHICYMDALNGTMVPYDGQKKLIEGENFMNIAVQDLKIVLRYVSLLYLHNLTEERHDIVNLFIGSLKPEKWFQVKKLEIWDFEFNDVSTIIPYFKTTVLENLKLNSKEEIDNFERIFHLDQWKFLRCFTLCVNDYGTEWALDSSLFEHFFHFEKFLVTLDYFSTQMAVKVRDDLMRRHTFRKFYVFIKKSKLDTIAIAKVFKPDYVGDREFQTEYSNNVNKFKLKIGSYFDNPNYCEFKVKKL